MVFLTSNIVAVIVTAFIPMILGALLYSRFLFGHLWMKYEHINKEDSEVKSGVNNKYILMYIGNFFTAYVLSIFVNYFVVASFVPALVLGALVWIGFSAPTALSPFLWSAQKKSWGLYIINIAYSLLAILLMSLTLTLWI